MSPATARQLGRVAPLGLPLLLYACLAGYLLYLQRSTIGGLYDDGLYFLMSRNVWRYGSPVIDYDGVVRWSTNASPMFSLLVSPLAWFRMGVAVALERVAVALTGAVWLALSYLWLRDHASLNRLWSTATACCLATIPAFVVLSTNVMTDIPAAAALMAGVVLLRRDRALAGTVLLGLAYSIRTVYLAPLAVVPVWLLLRGQRGRALVSGLVALGLASAWTALEVAHGTTDYFTSIRRRSVDVPGTGSVGWLDFPARIVSRLRVTVDHSMGFLSGLFDVAPLQAHAHSLLVAAAVAIIILAAVGMWRARLLLEGMISVAMVLAVSVWPSDSTRFLLPLSPFLLGSAAVALAAPGSPARLWIAASGCAILLAGNAYRFSVFAPVFRSERQFPPQTQRAYAWVRAHARPDHRVIVDNDIQAFLYSGHTATRRVSAFRPGATYVVAQSNFYGWDRLFVGPIVFRDPPIEIIDAKAKRPGG